MLSSIAWFTVANTPRPIKSAMILNGFCLSCSASSRTTIGGLMEMTCASAGKTTLAGAGGGSADLAAAPGFVGGASLAPGMVGPAGAAVAPRTLRISPRLLKSAFRGSTGRGAVLKLLTLSAAFGVGLGGNCTKPTLSPNFGPGGSGGTGLATGSGAIGDGGSLTAVAGPAASACTSGTE